MIDRDDRAGFEVPDDVAYFNAASLAPMLRKVRQAGEDALASRGRPWEIESDDWFADVERLRSLAARVMGTEADNVALVPSTSYGIGVAANNVELSSGDKVLVLAEEYPSGIYTWRAACERSGASIETVEREDEATWTDAVLASLDESVAVVSVPNVHWTDGSKLDLGEVTKRASQVGAKVVIDASQSLGAMPTNLDELAPDFLVSVGYKWLLGPFGVGYLYVAPRHHDGNPLEENWINRSGAEDFAALVDYTDEYAAGARRYDVGEHTWFELVPMAIAALEQVNDWGPQRISQELAAITSVLADRLTSLGVNSPAQASRADHMIGVQLPDGAPDDMLSRLAARKCYAAKRGSALRISPHLHVTDNDVDRFVGAMAAALGR